MSRIVEQNRSRNAYKMPFPMRNCSGVSVASFFMVGIGLYHSCTVRSSSSGSGLWNSQGRLSTGNPSFCLNLNPCCSSSTIFNFCSAVLCFLDIVHRIYLIHLFKVHHQRVSKLVCLYIDLLL